ncbi:YebW family protein [Symbiopectobacterium sp. Eva_TO]
MYALVVFICYLCHCCENLVIDAYFNEAQCLSAMDEQHLRREGCFPIEDFIDGYWIPAHERAEF